jgi:beta-galactosidase
MWNGKCFSKNGQRDGAQYDSVREKTMKNTNDEMQSLSRRSLLGQAVGAAGLVSALEFTGAASAQTQLAGGVRPARARDNFDFDWKFLKGDAQGAQQSEFADASWRSLDLPHDWSIEGPYAQDAPAGSTGASLPTGIGWYRKRFRLAEADRSKRVVVEFEGVYQNSEVWVNGQYLGKRPYGYISFNYDITPHVNFGARDNVIAVKVDNSLQPNCRWYSGSGIYAHTWLRLTNPVHVAMWGTFVTTPQVSANASTVQIKTRVQNESRTAAKCTLATSILDRDGKPVQSAEASQDVVPNGEYEFAQQVKVDKPNLWSVESPYLYTLRSTVRDQNGVVDVYDTPFGIREAIFDADRGFLLNGQQVKIKGVCLHHEAGPVGAAVPTRVYERRLEALKRMGCNGIRTSHNPYPPAFLDLCDKMGFLVMNEMFDEWKEPKPQTPNYGYRIYFDEWSERDTRSFIHRDRNRPSVILWSAGNEVVDQLVPQGAERLRRLVDIFHREDPTRTVTVGCDRITSEPVGASAEFLSLLDVVGYNYVDRWRDRAEKYYNIDRQAFPQRRFIGTENSSMGGGARGSYSGLFPAAAGMAPVAAAVAGAPGAIAAAGPGGPGGPGAGGPGGFGGGRGGARPNINTEGLWRYNLTYDYVAGDYVWTGIDYLGEARWPSKGSNSGVIDTCGFEKDGFYFFQSIWTKEPMVHVYPHWNWQGREGEYVPVTVYSNCESVELFVNGKSAGVQGYTFPRYGQGGGTQGQALRGRGIRTTGDLHLAWTIPYQPGTLRAVGTKDGKQIVEEITTAGDPAAIELTVDRGVIRADRQDVAHVIVKILDAQGRVSPLAANDVTFAVQGEGKLIGLDNGNMQSLEDYKGRTRKAFSGMCLAIVQAGTTPGQIRISATSAGLKPGSLVINTKA